MNEITKFLVDELLKLIPIPKLPAALQAILPLLAEFAQSGLVLNDDTRADIQLMLIRALRKAGLASYTYISDSYVENP